MTELWRQYNADFTAMSDAEIEAECDSCRDIIAESESWLEAVQSWICAGRPRTIKEPKP